MLQIKRENLCLGYLYIIFTTLLFFWLCNGYADWNNRLLVTLLFFWVTGFFALLDYDLNDMFFSQGVVFNGFALLYTCNFIIDSIGNGLYIPDIAYQIQLLSLLSVLSFNIAYCFLPRLPVFQKNSFAHYNLNTARKLAVMLLLLSTLAEFYVVFRQIGLLTILSNARAATSLLMIDYSVFAFFRYTFPLLMSVFLLFYLNWHHRSDFLLFSMTFIVSVLNAFLYSSRAYMLAVVLPLGFLLEFYHKIKKRTLLLSIFAVFILFGFWKSLFAAQTVFMYESEFNTWYRIGSNVLTDSFLSFRFGESYINTLINLVIPVTNIESLGQWYVRTYEHAAYMKGAGRGFSSIIESYINFGIFGNVIVFMFYGFIFKQLNKRDHFHIILYIIFLLSVYQIFRSDSYSMWKNMMWFRIYPTLIIFALAKRIK